jgi:hypothetical protein
MERQKISRRLRRGGRRKGGGKEEKEQKVERGRRRRQKRIMWITRGSWEWTFPFSSHLCPNPNSKTALTNNSSNHNNS